ncbi:MAG: hypothetical protein HY903_20555 [Deltaproteobacteria bacterium]|nr:hypothetical protein [Deltaproteobacteria bacterium]
MHRTSVFVSASCGGLFLVLGCGDLGQGVVDVPLDPEVYSTGFDGDAVKGKTGCSVQPNPVVIDDGYAVSGQGLARNVSVRITTTDGSGTREAFAISSADGTVTFQDTATALGDGSVVLAAQGRRGWKDVASCAFTVVVLPVCGDRACTPTEDCGNCAADCGVCPAVCGDRTCAAAEDCSSCPADCGVCAPVCGDGACAATEDCAGCAADCGVCAPVCGDGVCAATEDCAGCAADCGVCAPVCGDGACAATEDCAGCAADCGPCPICEPAVTTYGSGRHNAGKDCLACHDGSTAVAWTLAGTLYDNASGSNAIAGATIIAVDARGRELRLVTQANGNFYTSATGITFPVTVAASMCPSEIAMAGGVSSGGASCNSCHASGSRIYLR